MTDVTQPELLTIDELAAQVGMTVRNVRAHQSRGLLPPPEIRGRTGFYGPEHAVRLELVKDLQAEGFNLEAIKRIVERTPGSSSAAVLDFTRALAEPFTDEPPEIVDAAHFTERWGEQASAQTLERAQRLGFVRSLGDGRLEILSPRLETASNELARLGVPLDVALDLTETLKRHSEAIAKAYVRLFLDHVWRPFQESGEPEERWPEVREALERLRPLAGESLIAVFGLVMTDAVERALERELSKMGREEPPPRRAPTQNTLSRRSATDPAGEEERGPDRRNGRTSPKNPGRRIGRGRDQGGQAAHHEQGQADLPAPADRGGARGGAEGASHTPAVARHGAILVPGARSTEPELP